MQHYAECIVVILGVFKIILTEGCLDEFSEPSNHISQWIGALTFVNSGFACSD